MNILIIDTSTAAATVAITTAERVLAASGFSGDRTLSVRLIPEIEHLLHLAGLAIADIDLFAAATGPGSFTGVRGGVATAQGLALGHGRPCIGFSSLQLLALNLPLAAVPVCALIDARKNEVYAGLYDCSRGLPSPLIEECVTPPGEFLDLLTLRGHDTVIFCGDGVIRYRTQIEQHLGDKAVIAPFPCHQPNAALAAPLVLRSWQNGDILTPARLLPVYLRPSDAEINRAARPA